MSKLFVDEIVHQSSQGSGTITLGASGETTNIVGTLQNNGAGVGIIEADQWQLISGTSVSADVETFLTSGWSRAVPSAFNYIGTGMTESSGVFSFPQTGIYLVTFTLVVARSGDTRYFEARINTTTDNSNYSIASQSTGHIKQTSSGTLSTITTPTFVDVTNTSNVKVKFSTMADEAIDVTTNADYSRTNATFIRLGNT